VHFHIHDVRGSDFRDHRALGAAEAGGVIDFPRLVPLVRRIDYGGLWILELEEPDREGALRRSLEYLTAVGAAT
jgi:sugar phosphate isomerase/epimerase